MYYGLLNKGKTFRFLIIQIQITEVCLEKKIQKKKHRKKKQKNIKGRAFSGPVLSLLNRWMNSVEGVLCCILKWVL